MLCGYACGFLSLSEIISAHNHKNQTHDNQQDVLDGLQFNVSGSLANQSSQAAVEVVVIITTYDAEGRVTGYRQEAVEGGALAADGIATFSISNRE